MFDKIAHVMLFLGAASVFGMGVLIGWVSIDLIEDGQYALATVSAIGAVGVLAIGVAMVASFFK